MEKSIAALEPERLWRHFYALSQIPRCSKHEAQVLDYVLGMADSCGWDHRIDGAGNLVVRVPATSGKEEKATVVLQAHLDMVCEKDLKISHDFTVDGLRLKKAGDWVSAEGTTLGADNGIGVAACLAVMENKEIVHGPLELLYTVDEETGLTGAMGLDPDLLNGRIMINLDSEEDGALYIGCAGGRDTELYLHLETEPVRVDTAVRLHLGGLTGGHSGIDIDKGRGNAIRLLARFLREASASSGLRVASIRGGNKRNAIPRECTAVVWLPDGSPNVLEEAALPFLDIVKDEYGPAEPQVFLTAEEIEDKPETIFAPAFQDRLLNLLFALPNGVVAMSHAAPGTVQTSTNLGIVQTGETKVRIATSQRSSVPSQLAEITDVVRTCGEQAGAEIRQGDGYPGWTPNADSRLLATARSVYASLFGRSPEIKTIHAGLECGIIGDKVPGMDILSFGPTIMGAHSPSERVQISTVVRFWDFLVGLLKGLAV